MLAPCLFTGFLFSCCHCSCFLVGIVAVCMLGIMQPRLELAVCLSPLMGGFWCSVYLPLLFVVYRWEIWLLGMPKSKSSYRTSLYVRRKFDFLFYMSLWLWWRWVLCWTLAFRNKMNTTLQSCFSSHSSHIQRCFARGFQSLPLLKILTCRLEKNKQQIGMQPWQWNLPMNGERQKHSSNCGCKMPTMQTATLLNVYTVGCISTVLTSLMFAW